MRIVFRGLAKPFAATWLPSVFLGVLAVIPIKSFSADHLSKSLEIENRLFSDREVNLSEQLPVVNKMQFGRFSNIRTAIRMMEAACYRSTHKRVEISDSYLIYRQLAVKLRLNKIDMDNVAREQVQSPSLLGGFDTAAVYSVLQKAVVGNSVLTQSELGDKFFDRLKSKVGSSVAQSYGVAKNGDLRPYADAGELLRRQLIPQLEELFLDGLAPENKSEVKSQGYGAYATTLNPELAACQKNWKLPVSHEFSPKQAEESRRYAMQLLNAGIPFSCTTWDPFKYPQTQLTRSFMIHGYVSNVETPGGVKFKFQDSWLWNQHKHDWNFVGWKTDPPSAPYCQDITVLFNGGETDPFDANKSKTQALR